MIFFVTRVTSVTAVPPPTPLSTSAFILAPGAINSALSVTVQCQSVESVRLASIVIESWDWLCGQFHTSPSPRSSIQLRKRVITGGPSDFAMHSPRSV